MPIITPIALVSGFRFKIIAKMVNHERVPSADRLFNTFDAMPKRPFSSVERL
jgi:hypothetical protein